MIKVSLTYKDKLLSEINLLGHADYDIEGKDLVCAGASTCFLGGLNAIEEKSKIEYSYSKGNGYIKILSKLSERDCIVLEVMISQLKFIEKNYPDNIKVVVKKENENGN